MISEAHRHETMRKNDGRANLITQRPCHFSAKNSMLGIGKPCAFAHGKRLVFSIPIMLKKAVIRAQNAVGAMAVAKRQRDRPSHIAMVADKLKGLPADGLQRVSNAKDAVEHNAQRARARADNEIRARDRVLKARPYPAAEFLRGHHQADGQRDGDEGEKNRRFAR